jgi:hypothetical protein
MPTASHSLARRSQRLLRAGALAALAVFGAQASADVIYTYTGKPFETASGIFSTSDSLLFKFVLGAPVAASQLGATVAPLSWELTVGAWSISSATPGAILSSSQLSTDAMGNIDAACFSAFTPIGAFSIQAGDTVGDFLVLTTCSLPFAGPQENVVAGDRGSNGSGFSDFNSGTWVVATVVDPNPVPLPGTLALAALALLAAVGVQSRRSSTI